MTNDSTNQPINQHRSTNQHQPSNQSTPTNWPTNQPINTNQLNHQPLNTEQPLNQPTQQLIKPPNPLTNQPTNPLSQPINTQDSAPAAASHVMSHLNAVYELDVVAEPRGVVHLVLKENSRNLPIESTKTSMHHPRSVKKK